MEVPLLGRRYTCSIGETLQLWLSWIEFFCTADWEDIYLECVLDSHATEMSDHCPLILCIKDRVQGRRCFHFESYRTQLSEFMEIYQAKASTRALQSWSAKNVGHIKMQLVHAHEVLRRLEIAQYQRQLTAGEEWLRKELKEALLKIVFLERTIARLRSRVRQLKDGDTNTPFFHTQAAC
jgi:hypothetical protein